MASCQQNADWQSTKKTVLERGRYMFNNPFMSDIQFSCEGSSRKFHAHKYVLATSSSVFYRMFYGELAETKKSIELTDTNDDSLVEFLRFMYTDDCNLTRDNVAFVLYLTHKYNVLSLAEKCIEFFEANLTAENVFDVLQQAHHFNEKKLEEKCWDMIDLETSEAVVSDAFTEISQSTLVEFLKRETLNVVEEVDLFKAMVKWSEAECLRQKKGTNKRDVIGNAIYQIRFASMTREEFDQNVFGSGILTSEEMAMFYDKFSGVETTSKLWNMSERKAKVLLRCCRFDNYELKVYIFHIVNLRMQLRILFSKQVELHGIRLLGYEGKEYDVRLEVLSQSIENKFNAQRNTRGVPGFDVMLPRPVKVPAGDIVGINVTMRGPTINQIGLRRNETTETNGITVTFMKLSNTNYACRARVSRDEVDLIDEIIFSEI